MNIEKTDTLLYGVCRLNTQIEITNPLTMKRENFKINGIAGYMPIYDTYKEAEEASENGKYEILRLRTPKENQSK